eukprot:7694607-Pyramimonas_sp.AAC.1
MGGPEAKAARATERRPTVINTADTRGGSPLLSADAFGRGRSRHRRRCWSAAHPWRGCNGRGSSPRRSGKTGVCWRWRGWRRR